MKTKLPNKLYQCPYCIATKCSLTEPCLGCETFGEYLNEQKAIKKNNKKKVIRSNESFFVGWDKVIKSIKF